MTRPRPSPCARTSIRTSWFATKLRVGVCGAASTFSFLARRMLAVTTPGGCDQLFAAAGTQRSAVGTGCAMRYASQWPGRSFQLLLTHSIRPSSTKQQQEFASKATPQEEAHGKAQHQRQYP